MAIFDVWKAKRKGRKDGRNWRWTFWPFLKELKHVYPPNNYNDLTNYEKGIIDGAQGDISAILGKFSTIDAELKQRYCLIKQKLERLKSVFPIETAEAEEALKNFSLAQDELIQIGEPEIKKWMVILILTVLGITEFPLNGLVFSIFGEGKLLTYVMAGVIGVGIPVGAHYLGKVLRQEVKSKMDIAISTLVSLLIFGAIVVIGVLRAEYLSSVLSRYNIKTNMTSSKASMIFIVINLFLFFLATFISYLGTHKNNALYRSKKDKLKIAKKRLKKEAREATGVLKGIEVLEKELAKVKSKRQCLADKYYWKAINKKEFAELLCQIYRYSNIETRPDANIPPCFNINVNINVRDIRKLDWTCN